MENTITPITEHRIRKANDYSGNGCLTEKDKDSLATLLGISPTAAAEVALRARCSDEIHSPKAAPDMFTAWADASVGCR